MIEKGKFYRTEEDFNELTSDELKIFEIFLGWKHIGILRI